MSGPTFFPLPLSIEEQASVDEVWERLPELLYIRQHIDEFMHWLDLRIVLPRRLHEPFTGREEEGPHASVVGLPVVWSEREEWGVMVALAEPKETDR